MPYRIVDHTADLRAVVEGNSPEHLFSEALRCLMEILSGRTAPARGKQKVRRLRLKSADTTSLLIDFLNEALKSSAIHKEIYTAVRFKKFSETGLDAELIAVPINSFAEDVKAVTYHEASVVKKDGVWKTGLVFDI